MTWSGTGWGRHDVRFQGLSRTWIRFKNCHESAKLWFPQRCWDIFDALEPFSATFSDSVSLIQQHCVYFKIFKCSLTTWFACCFFDPYLNPFNSPGRFKLKVTWFTLLTPTNKCRTWLTSPRRQFSPPLPLRRHQLPLWLQTNYC